MLNSIENYSTWRDYFRTNLEKARARRHEIVHNGFRSLDIPEEELRVYHNIGSFVLSRMSGYLQLGILEGLTSLADIWEMMPLLVCENKNLKNDVDGTIIYTFKQGMFF